MSQIQVTIQGLDKLKELAKQNNGLRRVVEVTLHASAKLVVSYITQKMHSGSGGFPHVRTGNLVGSIQSSVHSWEGFEIYSNVSYSIFLEQGTSRMAARKFLEPSLVENLGRIEALFIKNLTRAYR